MLLYYLLFHLLDIGDKTLEAELLVFIVLGVFTTLLIGWYRPIEKPLLILLSVMLSVAAIPLLFVAHNIRVKVPNFETKELEPFRNEDGGFTISVLDLANSENIDILDLVSFKGVLFNKDGVNINLPATRANSPIPLLNSASRPSYFKDFVGNLSFSTKPEHLELSLKIHHLLKQKLIKDEDYIKSIASIAFSEGKNFVSNAEVDAYGAPRFNGSTERVAGAIATQFFYENCVSIAEVKAMCAAHVSELTEQLVGV